MSQIMMVDHWYTGGMLASLLVVGVLSQVDCRAQIRNAELYRQDAHLQIGKSQKEDGRMENLSRQSASRYLELGIYYTRRLQLIQARRAFEEALRLNPTTIRPYLVVARFYFIGEEWERLRDVLDRLAVNREIADRSVMRASERLLAQGREEEGRLLLEALVRHRRQSARSALLLGRIYLAHPDYERAIKYFDRVLEENPTQAEALFSMGAIRFLARDYRRAVHYLEEARRNGFSGPPLFYMLSYSLGKLDHVRRALRVYESSPQGARDETYMELAGRLLFLLNWRADRRSLPGVGDKKIREKLWRRWYGDAEPSGLAVIEREFQFLY